MQKWLLSLVAFSLMGFSVASTAAETIILKKEPVKIKQMDDKYVLVEPAAVVVAASSGAYYFTVDDTRYICFDQEKEGVTGLKLFSFNFKVGEKDALYCTTDLDQFTIQYTE